jgi:hypothetical protein
VIASGDDLTTARKLHRIAPLLVAFSPANVNLMFIGPVPPQRQHTAFVAEIAAFIDEHRHELKSKEMEYRSPSFSAPLMQRIFKPYTSASMRLRCGTPI